MAEGKFVLVVYDIPSDRRRTKLYKRLKDFGTPVQYSVFECILDRRQMRQMKTTVRKLIRPTRDHVRYYYLNESSRKQIEVLGRSEVTTKPKVIVV